MATKPSLAYPITRSNLTRLLATCVALGAAFGPSCNDSRPSREGVSEVARALSEPNWAPGTTYQIDDRVQYNGILYECLQVHTSAAGWEPPNTPKPLAAANADRSGPYTLGGSSSLRRGQRCHSQRQPLGVFAGTRLAVRLGSESVHRCNLAQGELRRDRMPGRR